MLQNIWHTRFDDYVIVQCVMLTVYNCGTKDVLKRHRTYEMFQRLKLGFQTNAHVKRYETSYKFLKPATKEKSSIVEHVLRLSEYYNHLNRVGVNLPDEIVMVLHSHCHRAIRASL